VALDIGANFGFMSLFMAKSVGPSGIVYALEPSPANISLLKYHREHNAGLKIDIVEAAASNQHRGTVRFFLLDGGLHSGNSLTFGRPEVPNLDPALHANQKEILVETVSVDGFCADKKIVPSLIKIDVEGGELFVLEGCLETLSCARPVLILAVHPWWLPEGRAVIEIQRLLADSGYIIMNEHGQQVDDLPYGEYLCMPSRPAASVEQRCH
jgi:FkbM family methyltransferase